LKTLVLILGLHIHIWIQQQYESSIGDNSQIRSIVFRKRNEEVAFALHKWRAAWNATLLHYPSSKPALYQKSALAFWYPLPGIWIPLSHSFSPNPAMFVYIRWTNWFRFLAKYFNEVKDSRAVCGANRQILPVGQLLRAIFMMMDNGKLNESSSAKDVDDVGEICAQSQVEGMAGEGIKGDKSLDTMMIDFIMYKKKD
jgi:hypothetical protein